MPTLAELYPSKYLKVEDLKGRKVNLTIDRVVVETVGTDTKPVAYFKETEKSFTLNKTNAQMIAMLTGSEDTDQWVGIKITLKPDITPFQGKPTPCIRVESLLPAQPNQPKGAVQVPETDPNDIPF